MKHTSFTISQCLVLIKSSVKFIDEAEDVEILFIEQFFKIGRPEAKVAAYDFMALLVNVFEYWWIEVGYAIVQNSDGGYFQRGNNDDYYFLNNKQTANKNQNRTHYSKMFQHLNNANTNSSNLLSTLANSSPLLNQQSPQAQAQILKKHHISDDTFTLSAMNTQDLDTAMIKCSLPSLNYPCTNTDNTASTITYENHLRGHHKVKVVKGRSIDQQSRCGNFKKSK